MLRRDRASGRHLAGSGLAELRLQPSDDRDETLARPELLRQERTAAGLGDSEQSAGVDRVDVVCVLRAVWQAHQKSRVGGHLKPNVAIEGQLCDIHFGILRDA